MNRALHILKKIVLVTLAAILFGWFVMTLWNWLMPTLFVGVHTLDFPHAIGLLVLSRILFGGFRHGGHGHWHAHWHDRWHQRWHERQEKMTPEEREKFRKGLHGWRGGWHDGWHDYKREDKSEQ